MALNPLRDALGQAGLAAAAQDSAFRGQADDALAAFRTLRADLERKVRRGDLTPKVAREQAAAAVERLRSDLATQADGYSPVPRVFLDRLVEASNARARARESMTLEGLQRETNRLLRQSLVEQQLVNRAAEFEGRAYVRSISGAPPSPTLDTLLTFHATAEQAGDEPAQEWARRQLESFRVRVVNPDDHRKIDLACDRPERVNPRIVATYVEAMHGRDAEGLETFVSQAIEGRDASACTAAFLLARQAPEGPAARWVRTVLGGLAQFPDAALASLRTWEGDTRRTEAEAARSQADFAIALAEAESRFPGLEAPSEEDLARLARRESLPVARPDEPIGLALDRRGMSLDDYRALVAADAGPDPDQFDA